MFTAALFTTAKRWKQPKYPSADECINKVWYTRTMEYYSAVKRNEVLIHAAIWINIENIKINEIGQTQKDKYCMIPLI